MSILEDDNNKEAPLYRRIQEALRDRIVQGAWSDGEALPNRRSLCSEFGTTRVTLDKAIDGLVLEGWLRTAAGSGTFVCAPSPTFTSIRPARLARPDVLRIGVVLGHHMARELQDGAEDEIPFHADNYFFGPLFGGIRDGLSGKSAEVTYAHVDRGDYGDFYHRSGLDGLLVIAPTLGDLPKLRALAAAAVPFVALAISSDATPEDAALPCVDTDNRRGAYEAVRHLVNQGHRRIALVNLALSHANHQDRMTGFQQALSEAGLSVAPDDLVLAPIYDDTQFEPRVENWVTRAEARGEMPTAIFACDYMMALATLQVLRRHGLRVPDDISVVGYDDPLSAGHLTPPLTTVRQPIYRMARRAVQRLLAHLQEGTPLQGTEHLPNELVIRDSTGPSPDMTSLATHIPARPAGGDRVSNSRRVP